MTDTHDHETLPERIAVEMNADGQPGFLVRDGGTYHFEDESGLHVSVHVWRIR